MRRSISMKPRFRANPRRKIQPCHVRFRCRVNRRELDTTLNSELARLCGNQPLRDLASDLTGFAVHKVPCRKVIAPRNSPSLFLCLGWFISEKFRRERGPLLAAKRWRKRAVNTSGGLPRAGSAHADFIFTARAKGSGPRRKKGKTLEFALGCDKCVMDYEKPVETRPEAASRGNYRAILSSTRFAQLAGTK